MGGQTQKDADNAIIEDFYAKLKKELIVNDERSKEIRSNGTELGRFLVTPENDMVERTTESLGSVSGSAFDVMKLMLRNQVIPVSAMAVKLGKNVHELAKKGFAKSLPSISVPTGLDKLKNTYLKGVIEQTVGDKLIDINFSSLREYLRDVINVFSRNRDDTKDYISRYIKRYSMISDITSEVAVSVNKALDDYQKTLDNKEIIGLSITSEQTHLGNLEKMANKIAHSYSGLIDSKITDDDDFFTIVNQKYKVDILSFAAKKFDEIKDNEYDGVTKRDVIDCLKKKALYATDSDKERVIFSTIKSTKGVNGIITAMQPYFYGLSAETLADKQQRELYHVIDDITIGEFYDQVEKFNKYTKDFKANVDGAISKLIESTTRTANITGTLATCVLNKIDKFSNLGDPSTYKLARLLLSIGSWTCIDLMTVVNALHYINANDLVMKLYLYENTVNFVKYIDDCVQSWRK